MNKDQLIARFFELKSQLNQLHPISPYATDRLLDAMLEVVAKLGAITPKDEIYKGSGTLTVAKCYETIYINLAHTASKQGKHIHHYHEQARKTGAAQKRQADLSQALRDLVDHVNMDTILIGDL